MSVFASTPSCKGRSRSGHPGGARIPAGTSGAGSSAGKLRIDQVVRRSPWKIGLNGGVLVALLVLTGIVTTDFSRGGPIIKNPVWLDVNGEALPFQAYEEIESFLKEALVVSSNRLSEGVSGARKMVLDREGVRAHAVFRDVEIRKQRGPGRAGATMLDFRDSCLFECAAYELSKLLGLNNIPPTVRRGVQGETGTLQIFIEKGLMEEDRLEQNKEPENRWRWMMQRQIMAIFDNLVHNDDRNVGNIIYDEDWNLWMIDHTRAFRTFQALPDPQSVRFCEADLWERLRTLDEETVRSSLQALLRPREIEGLLERRKKLVKHISALIEKSGERKVLFKFF